MVTATEAKARAAVAIVLAKRKSRPDVEAIAQAKRDAQDAASSIEACRRSFRVFLRHWHFINRETGEMLSFANLWPGQEQFAAATEESLWLFALKAGKLGFTELECAFDAWRALFAHPFALVMVLSKDQTASQGLLDYIKFGIRHLPAWFGIEILEKVAGGETTRSLMFRADWMNEGDRRQIQSFAASENVAIDRSLAHAHVDELSHMGPARKVWGSVSTIVEPEGTCHVVTRGAGDAVYSYELWQQAKSGRSKLKPFFVPWTGRPDRDAKWYEENSDTMTSLALAHFAPETEDDALMGDDVSPYIPIERWDQLGVDLPPLVPGSREAVVLSVDSAVSGDYFAITAATRMPGFPGEGVIRQVWVWRPQDFEDRRIDFSRPRLLLRQLCSGACANLHPRSAPGPTCALCIAKEWTLKPLNVVQVTYDPYQLEDMMQELRKEGIGYFSAFDQGTDRLIADAAMYRMAMSGTVHWAKPVATGEDADGNVTWNDLGMAYLRDAIRNCKAKLQADEESKMRMVKRGPNSKIDAAVSAGMGLHRIMTLNVS